MTRLFVGCAIANVLLASAVVLVADEPVLYVSGYFTGLGAAGFMAAAYIGGRNGR